MTSRFILGFLLATGIFATKAHGQETPLEQSITTLERAYEHVSGALDALTRANATGNEVAVQRFLSEVSFSVTQGIKWCERAKEAFAAAAAEMKSRGCLTSHNTFMRAKDYINISAIELAKADANLASAAGALNPNFIQRVHNEAAASMSTASRYLRLANEEMVDGVIQTKECVK